MLDKKKFHRLIGYGRIYHFATQLCLAFEPLFAIGLQFHLLPRFDLASTLIVVGD